MIFPGFDGFTFGKCVASGSKKIINWSLMNCGKSVKWYTELKPTPKRPVFISSLFFFNDEPIDWIDSFRIDQKK